MSFAKLAEELTAAATALTAQGTPATGADAGGNTGADAGASAGETTMAKALQFTLEDGTVVDALDGTALVKAMNDRMDKTDGELMGVLGAITTMVKALGDSNKALTETVASLRGTSAGRRSVMVAMPGAAGADAGAGAGAGAGKPQITFDELMAKAHAAQKAGELTGVQVAMVEGYASKGLALPEYLSKALR